MPQKKHRPEESVAKLGQVAALHLLKTFSPFGASRLPKQAWRGPREARVRRVSA